MHYVVLMTCGLFFSISHEVRGLSSKLDFGEGSEASLVKPHQLSVPIIHDYTQLKNRSRSSDNIVVQCTSSGCNETNIKGDNKEDSVKTDVIVQVKTSVDITNKNQTKSKEDIPDVPIVLGTNGIGSKNTFPAIQRGLQYQPTSRNYGDRGVPIVVTNIEDAFPSLNPTLIPESLYKEPHRDGFIRDQNTNFMRNPHENDVYRNRGSFHRAQSRDGFYGDLNSDGLYKEPNLDDPGIKLKLIPPEVKPIPNGYQYRGNGIEVKVPYFHTSSQNHYYGENSPPQVQFLPKKGMAYNPVAFNSISRPSYSFSGWNRNYSPNNGNHRHDSECKCPNERPPSGLQWYPNTRTPVNSNTGQRHLNRRANDPGSRIDNKLAPLD